MMVFNDMELMNLSTDYDVSGQGLYPDQDNGVGLVGPLHADPVDPGAGFPEMPGLINTLGAGWVTGLFFFGERTMLPRSGDQDSR